MALYAPVGILEEAHGDIVQLALPRDVLDLKSYFALSDETCSFKCILQRSLEYSAAR